MRHSPYKFGQLLRTLGKTRCMKGLPPGGQGFLVERGTWSRRRRTSGKGGQTVTKEDDLGAQQYKRVVKTEQQQHYQKVLLIHTFFIFHTY